MASAPGRNGPHTATSETETARAPAQRHTLRFSDPARPTFEGYHVAWPEERMHIGYWSGGAWRDYVGWLDLTGTPKLEAPLKPAPGPK